MEKQSQILVTSQLLARMTKVSTASLIASSQVYLVIRQICYYIVEQRWNHQLKPRHQAQLLVTGQLLARMTKVSTASLIAKAAAVSSTPQRITWCCQYCIYWICKHVHIQGGLFYWSSHQKSSKCQNFLRVCSALNTFPSHLHLPFPSLPPHPRNHLLQPLFHKKLVFQRSS